MPKILPDLRSKLLAETARLLTQEGYSAVTVRSVAQGCGVGVGTVYNYFPSKEAMLAQYLLADWMDCLAAIEGVSRESETAQPVAQCMYDRLLHYARSHSAVFQDSAARKQFSGSFGPYHGLLRSQLAQPLEKFCPSEFAAEFLAEAMVTWTMAGKDFCEIWALLQPIVNQSKE